MKHPFTLFGFFAALLFSVNIYAQSNCVASPEPVEVQQPNGETITVVGKGNMALPYMETIDGYTLLQDANGWYKYAIPAPDGKLIPSGVVAKNFTKRKADDLEVLSQVSQHVRYSSEAAAELKLKNEKILHKQVPDIKWDEHGHEQSLGSFPAKGDHHALLILIEYPDLPATYAADNFDSLLNAENYNNTGSFRDYYRSISQDSLKVQVDVAGWFTAENGYDYYGRKHSDYGFRVKQLVAQAIDSAEAAGIDFSKYDNDGDGYVDGIFIVHSGPGAEEGSRLQYVWSHRWSLAGQARFYDGVYVDSYIINPETRTSGIPRMVGIGIFCHEFGHLLGLPDLYDTNDDNGKSEGVGNWCLMGGGSWLNSERTPAIASAWSRQSLGWNNVVEINTPGSYTLNPSFSSHTAYKIATPNPNEYFLLENRQKSGFDKALPGRGLAIWHINKVRADRWPNFNDVNAIVDNKGVDLEEADGNDDLDSSRNRGDAGDLYPGLGNNTAFDHNSYPSSALSNGSASGIIISSITLNSDSTVSFSFGALPIARATASTLSVCVGEEVTFTSKSTYAQKFEWNFSDGALDTMEVAKHVFNAPGQYYVRLKVGNNTNFESSDSVLINVLNIPTPDFQYELRPNYVVKFSNKSTHAFNYQWDFGAGGGMSYFSNPTYTFPAAGLYNIKLKAFNSGCGDSLIREIHVYDNVGLAPNVATGFSWKLFPNPATASTNLYLDLEKSSQVSYRFINMNGQDLGGGMMSLESGESTQSIELPDNITPAIYILQVTVNGETINTRLSVL